MEEHKCQEHYWLVLKLETLFFHNNHVFTWKQNCTFLLCNICQNIRKKLVTENLYFSIFYAVLLQINLWISLFYNIRFIRIYTIILRACNTTHRAKLSINDFFSKCDQVRSFRWIWSYLLKKFLMENSIFCTVLHSGCGRILPTNRLW